MENIFNLEYECHPDPWFVDCALLVNQSVADWGTTSPTVVYWDSWHGEVRSVRSVWFVSWHCYSDLRFGQSVSPDQDPILDDFRKNIIDINLEYIDHRYTILTYIYFK